MSTKKSTVAWAGGIAACLILIALGVAYIVIGMNGRDEVQSTIAREQIVGTPDMTPQAITAAAKEAGLNVATLDVPTMAVAGVKIDTGAKAKAFAGYMRIHALEATGGQTYAQMGRFLDKNGKATSDEKAAAIDPKTKQPVENGLRNLWVTETALATGLNMSYFAEQVSLFGIAMGIALLVVGIGLGVITFFIWGFAPWKSKETAVSAAAHPAA